MVEKSLREVLQESRRIAHDAAAVAREAMQPLKTIRDVAAKIHHHHATAHVPTPPDDPSPRIVPGDRGLYEVHQAHDEEGRAAEYTVHRRAGHHETEFVGSFAFTECTMTLHCVRGVSTRIELARVAAAWLEQSQVPPS